MLKGIFFTSPYLLLLAVPLILGLIYAYRQKSNKNYKKVSTLFLFEKLRSRSLISQKVKLPWRFLAELIVMILLLLSLAGLNKSAQAAKVAILLDDSFSMNAVNAASSHFEIAKKAAITSLQQLTSDSMIAVVNNSAERFLSPAEAQSEISKLSIRNGANFEERLGSLAESGNYNAIYAFSDALPEGSGGHENIFYKNIKTAALRNLAISNARLDATGELNLEVVNFSDIPANYEVQIDLLNLSDQAPRVIDQISRKSAITEHSSLNFSDLPPADLYRLILKTNKPETDSILADSEYFLLPGIKNSAQVICFSSYKTEALKLDNFFPEIEACQSPEQYQVEQLKNKSLVLLLGFIPAKLPPANTLLIANSAKAESVEIVSWRTDSELLKYLKPGDLKFNNSEINPPAFFQNDITAESNIVLASAEISGARYVYSSTQLFPFTGDRSRALSILTLNIYNWLKAERAVGANANFSEVIASNGAELLRLNRRPEIYRYVAADKSVVVNQYNSTESDTFSEHLISLPSKFNQAPAENSSDSLVIKLLLSALVLLLLIQLIWDLFLRVKK